MECILEEFSLVSRGRQENNHPFGERSEAASGNVGRGEQSKIRCFFRGVGVWGPPIFSGPTFCHFSNPFSSIGLYKINNAQTKQLICTHSVWKYSAERPNFTLYGNIVPNDAIYWVTQSCSANLCAQGPKYSAQQNQTFYYRFFMFTLHLMWLQRAIS